MQQQKQIPGENLFPKIQAIQPELAGKITGMGQLPALGFSPTYLIVSIRGFSVYGLDLSSQMVEIGLPTGSIVSIRGFSVYGLDLSSQMVEIGLPTGSIVSIRGFSVAGIWTWNTVNQSGDEVEERC
ncbi:hypothetical protein B0T24DRAFT_685235 [Lasiosphaeria ovina]|uniref:PABC domain-containing protein n=1 Tax=Lasiosphaeria ovina TaxID=92902 RepID=A0AAE0JSK4_9PEZI|nr:hypothetical protein B0T24DRAFT_685235 [Lasiosphaeria ovina]